VLCLFHQERKAIMINAAKLLPSGYRVAFAKTYIRDHTLHSCRNFETALFNKLPNRLDFITYRLSLYRLSAHCKNSRRLLGLRCGFSLSDLIITCTPSQYQAASKSCRQKELSS